MTSDNGIRSHGNIVKQGRLSISGSKRTKKRDKQIERQISENLQREADKRWLDKLLKR